MSVTLPAIMGMTDQRFTPAQLRESADYYDGTSRPGQTARQTAAQLRYAADVLEAQQPPRPHTYDEDGFCACGAVEADESYKIIACTAGEPERTP